MRSSPIKIEIDTSLCFKMPGILAILAALIILNSVVSILTMIIWED